MDNNRIKTKKNAFIDDGTNTNLNEESLEKANRKKPKRKSKKHKSKAVSNFRKDRKILIIVDVQNDFISGSLGSPDCVKAEQRIVEHLHTNMDKYDAFYFTKDVHFDNYLETLEGKKLPVEHCIIGTNGVDFTDGIKEAMKALREHGKYVKVITKHTFGSTTLADILSVTCGGNDEIELCGVCTDICVISNALSLRQMMPNRVIKVNPTYCAGTNRAAHKAALRVMNSCQIDIIAGGNY